MATKTTRRLRERTRRLRKQRARKRARKALLTRVAQSPLFEDAVFRDGTPGRRKLSEVVLEFAEPVLEEATTDLSYRTAISLTTVAWNLALLPPKERKEALEDMAGTFDTGDEETFSHLMGVLIDRKTRLYGDDERFVVDYELTGRGTNARLDVCYAAAPPEAAAE